MAQLLVEENFQHLDGDDVESLIEALTGLGFSAEPTQPRTAGRGREWTLYLHWLRDDLGPVTGDDVALALVRAVTATLGQVHEVGSGGTCVQGRTLPVRIDIRGRAGELIRSIELPGAPANGAKAAKAAAPRWWRGTQPAAADGPTPGSLGFSG
ncbi:hypothetical protein [Kitasatospora sp. NPDC094011]|uniref:hypothetical protein n=1 Tax=Kitasatospora sp. NPDC094011 TaxID=3364090 RepID=UPI003808EE51